MKQITHFWGEGESRNLKVIRRFQYHKTKVDEGRRSLL